MIRDDMEVVHYLFPGVCRMLNFLIYTPVLVFAGWFWLRLGKWDFLHGKETRAKVVALYEWLLRLMDEGFERFRKH
jgi:hypothetical protein